MKTTIMLIFSLAFFSLSHAQNIDSILTIYASLNKLNGSVLVAKKGKIILQKGYGFQKLESGMHNDPETIFQVGSVTKEFTASVILQLDGEKKLSLNDAISKWFGGFPHGDSILVRHLLTHSSGIFNYTDIDDFWHRSANPTSEQAVVDTLKNHPLLFAAGTKFSYSNSNYMLLAYIIARVTGKPFESVVRERIFAPLQMTSTGFDFKHLKTPGKATGYWKMSAALVELGPVGDSSQYIGSGELYSTVGDLYKWHQALQRGKILTPAQQKLAYFDNAGNYGFGWELDTFYNRKIAGHSGRMFGFESSMIRIPEDDICIILLNNSSDGPYLAPIGKKLLSVLYHQPFTMAEQPEKLTAKQLQEFTGKYSNDNTRFFTMAVVNGHLFGSESEDTEKTLELFPLKNDRLHFMEREEEEGSFEVNRDSNGHVTGITIRKPNGNTLILKKQI